MRNTIRKPFCRFALLLACWPAFMFVATAGSWPGFRGQQAHGVAASQKPPVRFGPSTNLLWKSVLLPGLSSPVVWNDDLFITAAQSNTLSILCFDKSSGAKRWQNDLTVPKLEPVHRVNSHATSTPVTDGKAVYAYFGSFGLLAYDVKGRELWRKPLPIPQTFFNQGSGTSPLLVEDKLLVFVQQGPDSHLLALHPVDGRQLWKAPMPVFNNTYSTPVTWKEGDKPFVGLTCAMRFTAFDLAHGEEAWWVEGLSFQACSTPSVAGDRLVLSVAGVQGEISNITLPPTFDEALEKYDADKDGALAFTEIPTDLLYTDRQATEGKGNMPLRQALSMFGGVKKDDVLKRGRWEEVRKRLVEFRTGPMNRTVVLAVRTGGRKNATDSHIAWKETRGVPEVPSPLVWQDRVYLIRSGGLLVCRELDSGKLIYEERLGTPAGYFASPVLADGRLYLASDRGVVSVVAAGDRFEVLAHNELADPILASPAIADDVLFIRSAGQLWAFKAGAPGNP